MGELIHQNVFKKFEKAIGAPGPLSPDRLKGAYDTALKAKETKEALADQRESTAASESDQDVVKLRQDQADQYRRDGQAVVETVVHDAASYVERNQGHYYGQAQEDMAASQRKAA